MRTVCAVLPIVGWEFFLILSHGGLDAAHALIAPSIPRTISPLRVSRVSTEDRWFDDSHGGRRKLVAQKSPRSNNVRFGMSYLGRSRTNTSDEFLGRDTSSDKESEVISPMGDLSLSMAPIQRPWWESWEDNMTPGVGRALVIAAAAIYGTNFATVKLLAHELPWAVSAAARFGVAALVVSGLVLASEDKNPTDVEVEERNGATLRGAEVGVWYAVAFLSQAVALLSVDASKSAFFNALAVIVVPILDALFKNKKLGLSGMASIALAIGGMGLMQMGDFSATKTVLENFSLSSSKGDIFCLAQALFFGVGYWRLEDASHDYPHQAGRITAGQLIGVAAGVFCYCGFTHAPLGDLVQAVSSNPFVWKGLLWTGLISTALAIYLETVALKIVSATELTILMTSVSLFGSAFAYFTMGEILSPAGMLGGLLILSGCVISALVVSPPDIESLSREETKFNVDSFAESTVVPSDAQDTDVPHASHLNEMPGNEADIDSLVVGALSENRTAF